ncbi:MAG TPA: hypothetical protein VFJ61_00960 [Solirubrobacterales bacterium]|nr:hypothetical protein [Solirubrobacterales bacterium]
MSAPKVDSDPAHLKRWTIFGTWEHYGGMIEGRFAGVVLAASAEDAEWLAHCSVVDVDAPDCDPRLEIHEVVRGAVDGVPMVESPDRQLD